MAKSDVPNCQAYFLRLIANPVCVRPTTYVNTRIIQRGVRIAPAISELNTFAMSVIGVLATQAFTRLSATTACAEK